MRKNLDHESVLDGSTARIKTIYALSRRRWRDRKSSRDPVDAGAAARQDGFAAAPGATRTRLPAEAAAR
jgi:hypothetical protein